MKAFVRYRYLIFLLVIFIHSDLQAGRVHLGSGRREFVARMEERYARRDWIVSADIKDSPHLVELYRLNSYGKFDRTFVADLLVLVNASMIVVSKISNDQMGRHKDKIVELFFTPKELQVVQDIFPIVLFEEGEKALTVFAELCCEKSEDSY